MKKLSTKALMLKARDERIVIPAFNIPHLPMMSPIVRAIRDTNSFALIAVARLEWIKFEAKSPAAIRDEYQRVKDEKHTRLHMDHIPVIDEDNLRIDALAELTEAVELGFTSIMVDGSRLTLDENIARTREITEMTKGSDVAVEAELGAVLGHSDGPMPPYEELFASGKGFTDVAEAKRFVDETNVDWLSVAVGSVHGAISAAKKSEKKVAARINIAQLQKISDALDHLPLVLHGGSGIRKEYIMQAVKNGITKINVGTAIRQPYESNLARGVEAAQQAAYDATVKVIREELEVENTADILTMTEGA